MTLTVRVISPDRTVWDAEADEVVLPSTTGQLGVLSGHVSMITALDTGVMRLRRSNREWIAIALMGGFAEVNEDELVILVNGAELGSNIDIEEAREAYNQALYKLNQVNEGDRQRKFQANQAFKRARARLQAAGGVVQI